MLSPRSFFSLLLLGQTALAAAVPTFAAQAPELAARADDIDPNMPKPPQIDRASGKYLDGPQKDRDSCYYMSSDDPPTGSKSAEEGKAYCLSKCPGVDINNSTTWCAPLPWPPGTPAPYAGKAVVVGKETLGFCECESTVARGIAEAIVKGLPGIAAINCHVFMGAFQAVAEAGSALLPGVGPEIAGAVWMGMDIASQIAAKATNDEDAGKAFSQWAAACPSTPETKDIDKSLQPLLTAAQGAGLLKPGGLKVDPPKNPAAEVPKKPDAPPPQPDKPVADPNAPAPSAPKPGDLAPPPKPSDPAPAPKPSDPAPPAKPDDPAPSAKPSDPAPSNDPAKLLAAACKGKRADDGPGCQAAQLGALSGAVNDAAAANMLSAKLGARKIGDNIPDKPAPSLQEKGYQERVTPPAKPDDDFIQGSLDSAKAGAPAGSPMKEMDLKGYTRTAVRSEKTNADDDSILTIHSNADKDQHVIVEGKDKASDLTPDRLQLSEVLGQTMDKQFAGNFGGKLKRVTQYHVSNADSKALIEGIWGRVKHDGNMVSINRDLGKDSDWTKLAQSANGGALFRYSNDHFDRLGGWQPTSAQIYKQEFDWDEDGSSALWHLMWIYGKP